jgi:hypothetical protein
LTTLIAIYNNDGLLGRCDARCYDAKQPHCDCVCGGKNHGRGIHVAAQNTVNDAAAWLEAATPPGIDTREIYAKVARDLRHLAQQTFIHFTDPNPETEPAD